METTHKKLTLFCSVLTADLDVCVLYCGVRDAAILNLPLLIPHGLALMIRPIESALDRWDDGACVIAHDRFCFCVSV